MRVTTERSAREEGYMPEYELKLKSSKVVVWEGKTPEDAARRYVDCHRDQVVVATRPYPRHGLFLLGTGRIVG